MMVSDAPGCCCRFCGGEAEIRRLCESGCCAWWECVSCYVDGQPGDES